MFVINKNVYHSLDHIKDDDGNYIVNGSVKGVGALDGINADNVGEFEKILFEKALKTEEVKELRKAIENTAGDTKAILGTTADATQLLMFSFASLITKLSIANSIKEVREAALPFNDLAIGFLSKVESGQVKLPFQSKGLENVVKDIERRATAVAEVLNND